MRRDMMRLLEAFMNLPTAPFAESAGLRFIRDFVNERRALSVRADRFGNLLIHYQRGAKRRGTRPVLLAAHLDHPGFVAESMEDRRRVRASWRGWVRPDFFDGARVRFWDDGRWVKGRVTRTIAASKADDGLTSRRRPGAAASARSFGAESPPEAALIRVQRPVGQGAPGMWDFPNATVKGGRLHARACDDVAGAGAILCLLDRACREKIAGEFYAFFTRAEEVGFGGALAAVADRGLPKSCIVVAIECSKAVTGVTLGAGPVLRVGDRATVFTPAATAFCQTVAEDLMRVNKRFRYQRKLMDGGTCESTVYCHYGYDATGLCLPMLNYHNMDLERGRLAPEIVDLSDLENLVEWFVALVRTERRYDGTHPGLDDRLDALLKRHRPVLLRTAGAVAGSRS